MSDIMPSISAAGLLGSTRCASRKLFFAVFKSPRFRCEQAFDVVSVAKGEVFRTRLAEGARCFVQLLSVDELFDLVCLIHDIAKVHFCREYGASMLSFFRRAR